MYKSLRFVRHSLAMAAAGAGVLYFATWSAVAQEAKAEVKEFGNWQVVCPASAEGQPKPQCYARLTITDTARKVQLVTWTIGFNGDGKTLMEIVSPVDVFIEPGVSLKLEPGEESRLAYVSCGTQGCLSRIEIDKSMLAALKSAESASIAIEATNGKRIAFGLKMTGSAKALSELGL